ncbi:hypothetical protein [Beijerinckia sp. L45]|uniref:hypothetical protein n=1 Tax=Beijerinckia sp. L45 TaxID=1641855 RepID=UPI00131C27B8|nr:hypothetical protein [Beijerinckia sp. L45]
MAAVTYYVALPFVWSEDGELVAGEAQERQTASAAIRAAQALANTPTGAVAFSRTGGPSTGDFADAEVIRSFGTVPDADTLLAAP